jgi:hypothetical protein
MNKQITFRAVLAVALLTGCGAIEAKPPTCAQPLGKWNDETKSVIEIRTYDTATGAITGEFISHTDVGSYPMVGWINSAPAESSAPGAITTWTGTCAVNSQSGLAQISTLWHTARPDTGHEWDHLVTGSEVLVPIE